MPHYPHERIHQSGELQSRAGLLASEASLIGLGAGLALAMALALSCIGAALVPIGRDGLVVSAGLVSAGLAASALGHWLDLGGCRKGLPRLARTWGPLMALGALLAGVLWLTALGSWPPANRPLPATLAALMVIASLLSVAVLAALGLRAVAAAQANLASGLALLLQAVAHHLAGGLALYVLLVAATDRLTPAARQPLTSALTLMLGLAALWATLLRRGVRMQAWRYAPPGSHGAELERAHWLASAATLIGLALPGLVVLYANVSGRDGGLLIACGLAAGSGHVMRYAWVVLTGRDPIQVH